MTFITILALIFVCLLINTANKQKEASTVPIIIKNKIAITGKLAMGLTPGDTTSSYNLIAGTGSGITGFGDGPLTGPAFGSLTPGTLNGTDIDGIFTSPDGADSRYGVMIEDITIPQNFFNTIDFDLGTGVLNSADAAFSIVNGTHAFWEWTIVGDTTQYVNGSGYNPEIVWAIVEPPTPEVGEIKITPASPVENEDFGYYVDISANGITAIASAINDNVSYVFTRSGNIWTEQQMIQPADNTGNNYFGQSISVSSDGNIAVIGAPGNATAGTSSGAAYVFTRSGSTWTEQQKIQSSDIAANDELGFSVGMSADGNNIIVGAYKEDTGASDAGAAYIFTRTPGDTGPAAWTEQQKIQASDLQTSDLFGNSVSISSDGNTAIVGTWKSSPNLGAAYVFTRSGSTWTEQQKIQSSDIAADHEFGYSVSISGDGNDVVVGAYDVSSIGAAYVFTRTPGDTGPSAWSEQQKIQASDNVDGGYFGWTVDISTTGSTLVAGMPYSNKGSAYVFTRSGSTWTETKKVFAYDGSSGNEFSFSVAISINSVLVGSALQGNAGAAYSYDL